MKKILTVETVKNRQKLKAKIEELRAYTQTEKGFAEFSKEIYKLWDKEFNDDEEDAEIAGLLLAYWLDIDCITNDEAFTLFGKKMANFVIAGLNQMSTEKAKKVLKEKIMAE